MQDIFDNDGADLDPIHALDGELSVLSYTAARISALWDDVSATDVSAERVVGLLLELGDGIRNLRVIDDMMRAAIIARAETKEFPTAFGPVEVLKRTKRTAWQMDDLLRDVVARIADERDVIFDGDGERVPWPVAAQRLVARLRECVSMSGGKVTGLRGLEIQPDEYCQETPDGWSLKLPAVGA